ncbi:MAG: hypothetical protein ACKO0Z_22130 [Betaproteobacteria bacterium]
MPLQYTYTDGMLKSKITEAVEARAVEFVKKRGEFDYTDANGELVTTYTEGLRIYAAYIIASLESATAGGDNYYSKLKEYSTLFDKELAAARMAAQTATKSKSGGCGWMAIPLTRA